ncbi:MAG: hypothetical protein EX271_07130 [Acidimicrobiales bacterium]|nr:hypothetical protein [Hyphomonadaceae bacterium]RZV41871.1 MAG: hypothetical protein EX271_07130 [Acidimicrobiales bacterium]
MNLKHGGRILVATVFGLLLTSCATATRGSHTIFKVETVPDGARVVTDLKYEGDPAKFDGVKQGETIYYGCEATPCGIKLPRRSDFNVMVIKPGYQPNTYAVFKERNKMQARKSEATGMSVMAGGVVLGGIAVADAAASATIFSEIFFPAAAAGPAVVILAMPVAGAATGVDLATGALIDLRPNPLQMDLVREVSPEDTDFLVSAFMNSRRIRNEASSK